MDSVKSPAVSIIIPVYNASKTISVMVSSILNQTFQDFELILVDDGSTDSTLNVLRGLKARDKRIVIRSKKNGGPSSARNDGLGKARGKYVMFFDADDDVDNFALEKFINKAEVSASDLVVSGWQIDKTRSGKVLRAVETLTPPKKNISGDSLHLRKFIVRSIGDNGLLYNLWNKLFRLDIINEHDIRFREDIRFGEDLIFSFHYFAHVSKLSIIPDALYHYQVGSETSVFSKSALDPEYRRINNEELDLFAGAGGDEELQELTDWVKWRWLLSYYRIVAASNLTRNEKLELIRKNSSRGLRVAKNSKVIGSKKLTLERLGKTLSRSPRAALLFGKSAQAAKDGIVRIKS